MTQLLADGANGQTQPLLWAAGSAREDAGAFWSMLAPDERSRRSGGRDRLPLASAAHLARTRPPSPVPALDRRTALKLLDPRADGALTPLAWVAALAAGTEVEREARGAASAFRAAVLAHTAPASDDPAGSLSTGADYALQSCHEAFLAVYNGGSRLTAGTGASGLRADWRRLQLGFLACMGAAPDDDVAMWLLLLLDRDGDGAVSLSDWLRFLRHGPLLPSPEDEGEGEADPLPRVSGGERAELPPSSLPLVQRGAPSAAEAGSGQRQGAEDRSVNMLPTPSPLRSGAEHRDPVPPTPTAPDAAGVGVAQLWGQGVGAALLPATPPKAHRPVSLQHRVSALLSAWPASGDGEGGMCSHCPPSELALRLWARGVLRHASTSDRAAVQQLHVLLRAAATAGTEAASARSEFHRAQVLVAAADPSGSAAQIHSAFRLPLLDLLATHEAILRAADLARRAVFRQRWRALVSGLLLRADAEPLPLPSTLPSSPLTTPQQSTRPVQLHWTDGPAHAEPVANTPRRRLRVLSAERLARVGQARMPRSASGAGPARGGRRKRVERGVGRKSGPGARSGAGLEQRLSAAYHVAIVRGLRR